MNLFVSETWLKQYTPLSDTVDYKDILPFIEPAQDQLIRPRLGDLFYVYLSDLIETKSWNTDELELLEMLRPAVGYYTIYLALPFLQSKIRNKGVVKGTDQFIQTISRQDMLDMRQEILQLSSFYMNKVDVYLCDNGNLFPNYTASGNDKQIVEPFDFAGWIPFNTSGYGLGSNHDLIKTIIGYK